MIERKVDRLYPLRYLVPAITAKHQPQLVKLYKLTTRRGEVYLQWRWPWE